jgi:vancomycin permeability regulator SanA
VHSYLPLHRTQAEFFAACSPNAARANVIVVLGYAIDALGKPTPTLEFRLEAAVELWRQTGATIVLSGGSSDAIHLGRLSEARAMETYITDELLARGEEPVILLEERSTSTRENALFSLRIVDCMGAPKTVAVVTSTFHQWRSRRVFVRAATSLAGHGVDAPGCTIAVYPCARPHALERGPTQFDWLREFAACALYWWRDWL